MDLTLFEAILLLKTPHDVEKFLKDLCGATELEAMLNRFEIAKKLKAGVPQHQIAKELKVSVTTVTKINHIMKRGTNFGFRNVLERYRWKHPLSFKVEKE